MGITTGQLSFHQMGMQAVVMLGGVMSKGLAEPCHTVLGAGIVTESTT